MRRRMDKYKKENNLTKMVTLFEANKHEKVRNIETQLVDYYRTERPAKCLNRTGGGGGCIAEGATKYQLYIALED